MQVYGKPHTQTKHYLLNIYQNCTNLEQIKVVVAHCSDKNNSISLTNPLSMLKQQKYFTVDIDR